jgi:hypothetical protein
MGTAPAPGISRQFSRAYAWTDHHRTEKSLKNTRIYSLPDIAPIG